MKNNKIVIYIGLVTIGLLLGWLLFSGSSNEQTGHNHDELAETNQMWTCSMHPQIMQPEPGDCPICGMDLIPAESGSDGLLADQFKLTENAMALANIQTTVVGKGNVDGNTLKLSGKIAENEEANAVQVSYFSGRIERLNVSFTGEEVRKGQLLATIYSPELYAAQQELITASSLKESQPELYKAVRNKLKLWKLSVSQINQIEETQKVKENFPVYATVSGTVTEKLVEQGDYIKQGQPLLKIANLNTVWANFDVYENQIDLFKKGQEVLVTTNAYANKEFKGKVDFIEPILNTKTRTVTLRVVLNNKNDVFKPGMFVTANIERVSSSNDAVLTIPASAVLWTGKRSVVYLKTNPDQTIFEMREVVLGNQIGNEYEVLEGLFIGNEIVTNGTFTVDAAAQLQGKKSMMNKNGGKVMTGHEGHLGMDNKALKEENDHTNMNERLEVSEKFQEQLKVVYNDYINLKDALVNEDSKTVMTISNSLLDNISKVYMKLLKDEAHTHWVSLEKEVKIAATSISKTSDIKEQRVHFKDLSSQLINAVQLFGINEKVYVKFCPMAENNNGAYWLSKEEKVINPYFGSTMLTCGEVKQVIE
ncbi:efflux RND transporter periplasmic adaptor subunit [Cellulophaga lytica]|uniref:RND family efflux transporter MFP subunit n=1 Tax=Cellulophaga geojensis KL-A TaxID=1328323 RepID=A0ABN0RRW6_9FLAO|nr:MULTISPECIES: efflux RND transporter periplasmic adaptor subunit [Cellulophaga]APU11627.1 efflux transporter periplasmic adaptor subunit [Cellulophaga lytica]EWH14691.1 RND family efflux transporter MFP subunit [Cellulophaga geojensis KL-A]TVZ09937.1 Cu(I)/Ag(I) efflux system membrane fusion protein [Cellulophaga sp. RHA_52]WKB81080.1 efflux RND transporter periplasmic adaptor subunit [Cellulophaga lytica]